MTNLQSSRDVFRLHSQSLSAIYPKEEAETIVLWLLDAYVGLQRKDILLDNPIGELPAIFTEGMEKLMEGVPVQYVMGRAPFYGREFLVNPHVLIPRNETEELVHWMVAVLAKPQRQWRILDIGTGSGCIPVTLAKELPMAKLAALDVSRPALEVAQENAKHHGVDMDFFLADIRKDPIPQSEWDLIVSNPPYVRESEKIQMRPNVLDHEPHLALFVPDPDPLVFYRVIAEKSFHALASCGALFFEINEAFGKETVELLGRLGYVEIELKKDLHGKDRMVRAEKP